MDCSNRDFRQAVLEGRLHEVQFPISDPEEEIIEEITEEEPREAEVQDSQGVLEQAEETAQAGYRTINICIGVVRIREINYVEEIPDFSIETTAQRPIIAQTPRGYFCLEGRSLIEDAERHGLDSIECEIHVKENHSVIELMLMKASMRTATRGGAYVYAEVMRNTRDLDNYLMASDTDLRIFSHGGSRRREDSDPEKDAVHVISIRLGLDRDTVNSHLNYAKNLSDEALERFIQERATKKFFENAQNEKRKLARRLEEQRLSDEEITRQISELMLKIFEETGGKGRAEKTCNRTVPVISEETRTEPDSSDSEEAGNIDFEPVFEDEMFDEGEEDDDPEDTDDLLEPAALESDIEAIASDIQSELSFGPMFALSEIETATRKLSEWLDTDVVDKAILEKMEPVLTRKIETLSSLLDRVRSKAGKN